MAASIGQKHSLVRKWSMADRYIVLCVGYPQILASGYLDSKFTIRFSPNLQVSLVALVALVAFNSLHMDSIHLLMSILNCKAFI